MSVDGIGREKNIETPEKMFELFEAYVTEVKNNPFYLAEQKKGNTIIPKNFEGKITDISLVDLPKEKPLSLDGFGNYCFKHKIHSNVEVYFANTDGLYSAFLSCCSRIRSIIRQDQIDGGMAGIYNPSITQRLNGLVDKQENTNITKMTIEYEDMSDE